MELVFVCRKTRQSFRRRDYSIIANRGVTIADDGHKVLDARVKIDQPCPFCGRRHVYHADELACPLAGQDGQTPIADHDNTLKQEE